MADLLRDGEVLVVTGPPGAGKSTVAQAMAQRHARCVVVRGDDVLSSVVSGFVTPWLPESDHQNRVALAATAAQARSFAEGGYAVIVDAVLGPWHLDHFAAALGAEFGYVVLRPSRAVTVARATTRANGELTDPEPVGHMWAQFSDLGVHEPHALDSGDLDPERTVDAVLAARVKRRLGATPD